MWDFFKRIIRGSSKSGETVEELVEEGVQGESDKFSIPGVTIEDEIGKGSMAYVYRGWKGEKPCAIKVPRWEDIDGESHSTDIIKQEANALSIFDHPSIPKLYLHGCYDGLPYLVMEYFDGITLYKAIKMEKCEKQKFSLTLKEKIGISIDVANTYHHIHQKGWIGIDIKPSNIGFCENRSSYFVDSIKPNIIGFSENRHVYVVDFNISKPISSWGVLEKYYGKEGVVVGTPNYMSPEQIMGKKMDQRSDIFSLGSTFYDLLAGEIPFHGENLSSVLYQITQVNPQPIKKFIKNVPNGLQYAIDKALAKKPEDRFQTVAGFAWALQEVYEEL